MDFEKDRREMVKIIREDYGFRDGRIMEVMSKVPRHKNFWGNVYNDAPVDIGFGQTMSQPYTVAMMTNLLIAKGEKLKAERVLEIGTGSGYQAAILSHFFDEVYTVEVIPQLSHLARNNLSRLGYKNVFTKLGSGECGWKEYSPFDAIVITAAIEKEVPKELFDQLSMGGVLVAPVGRGYDKTMTRFIKINTNKYQFSINTNNYQLKFKIQRKEIGKDAFSVEEFGTFRFVPFVKE